LPTPDQLAQQVNALTQGEQARFTLLRNAQAAQAVEEEPLPLITMGDYLQQEIEIPPVLVAPTLLVRSGVLCTVARSGKGKTVFNMNRLVSWAAGVTPFPEAAPVMKPSGPLKTLIVEAEGAAALFHAQVRKMVEHGPFNAEHRRLIAENITLYGDGGYQNVRMDDVAQHARLERAISEIRPDILFIEPLRHLHSKDENNSQEMAKVLMALMDLASTYELAVITAHHERKSGVGDDGEAMSSARGSTTLEGALTVMENLKHVSDGDYLDVTWSKSRYGAKPSDIRLKWDDDTNWYAYVGEDELAGRIVKALSGSDGNMLTLPSLADTIGEATTKVRFAANALVVEGKLARASQGRDTIYRIRSSEDGGLEF
jgi:RecA-family ATPase